MGEASNPSYIIRFRGREFDFGIVLGLLKRVATPNIVVALSAIIGAGILIYIENRALSDLPTWISASENYDSVFDVVAEDLGFNFRTFRSLKSVENHILTLPLWSLPSYRLRSIDDSSIDVDEVKTVVDTIENRFSQQLNRSFHDTLTLNRTLDTIKRLRGFPKDEARWLINITQDVYPIVQKLFGRQLSHRSAYLEYWFEEAPRGNLMEYHYFRTRGAGLPNVQEEFRSGLPWLPSLNSWNAQWPKNMTDELYDSFLETLGEDHPLFYPYTLIRETYQTYLSYPIKDDEGAQQEFLVLGDKNYRVLNIFFDGDYRYVVKELIEAIRNSNKKLKAPVNNLTTAYMSDLAAAFEAGDFNRVLELDLSQSCDPIFFTVNHHGKMWENKLKGAFQFAAGVVDAVYRIVDFPKSVEFLEEQFGLVSDKPDPDQIVLFWPIRTAGVLRVLPYEPLSFVYPQDSKSLSMRRAVVLLDIVEEIQSRIKKPSDDILPDEQATLLLNGLRAFMLNLQIVYLSGGSENSQSILAALLLCFHGDSEPERDISSEDCFLSGLFNFDSTSDIFPLLLQLNIIRKIDDGFEVDFDAAKNQEIDALLELESASDWDVEFRLERPLLDRGGLGKKFERES